MDNAEFQCIYTKVSEQYKQMKTIDFAALGLSDEQQNTFFQALLKRMKPIRYSKSTDGGSFLIMFDDPYNK